MKIPSVIFSKRKQPLLLVGIIIGILLILVACSDLVTESDTGACNTALDERNYQTALTVCTSRQDKASAYMGLAGYDIVNLLKSSSSTVSAYSAPSGVSLGTDSVAGASIMNILQLGVDTIPVSATRITAVTNAKNYLDNASALLHPYLTDNSSPLTTDEILLDSFALAFAMQLDQIMYYDNATTSTLTFPSGDPLACTAVTGSGSSESLAVLVAMDGHLWSSERDGTQCANTLAAINNLSSADQASVALKLASAPTALPSELTTSVCTPLNSLTTYLSKLVDATGKLTLSGDNTQAITDAQTSTTALLTTVGCN